LILIKKLIISTKLTIPLDSCHKTPNKWNETILTLFSPRVRIRSTVFIFVTVSITSLYNGGLQNINFVVKIYLCFLTVKISKATWSNHRATSTSLLALVQNEVSSHKAISSPSNVSPEDVTKSKYCRGRRGRDRMIVGFTTTYAFSTLSPLMLWVRISIRARCTTLCDKVCQWLATASSGLTLEGEEVVAAHFVL
jgi:hypothetical protein